MLKPTASSIPNDYCRLKSSKIEHCNPQSKFQIDNLFISEQGLQQTSRMQSCSSAKTLLNRRRVETQADLLKKNILKIRQNRRVNDLKELTKQNYRMFFRIQARKSQYKFEQLRRQVSSKGHCPSQPKTNLDRHCQSAKDIRVRCSSVKSSVFDSKITIKPLTTLSTEGASHQSLRICDTQKENRQINSGRSMNSIAQRIADKQYEQKLLLNKLGLKVPAQTIKLMTGKTELNSNRPALDLKQRLLHKLAPVLRTLAPIN